MWRIEKDPNDRYTSYHMVGFEVSDNPSHVGCELDELPDNLRDAILLLDLAEGEVTTIGLCTTGPLRTYYIYEDDNERNDSRMELFIA